MAELRSPALLGPTQIRDLAARLDLQPTKKLGQNFVVDANTVRKIVRTAEVGPGDHVVEVGPGLGSLTLGLLEAGARVTAVELDGRLADLLPHTVQALQPALPPDALTVIHDDALRVQVPGAPTRLVANLPYNVSVPVLLHLLATVPSLEAALVMVQAEVGERLAAAPGSKVYGSPSVKAAWYGTWRTAGTISRQVFWPVPNVDSILVSFARTDPPGTPAERDAVFTLVDAAFGQRRKMLRQALADAMGGSAAASACLEAAGIDPTLRGEQLTVADFLALARAPRPS
ncbi:MAG TPA: 16S rRNA (adenine(1518)-N(6)/adenine(1519)-N(6))-dimethyltransferase RsmA [Pseudolysinimonas sp.]|nr:16S rRNA (adenine(1518)-N(6)/adenine(1519)-N(6))-dimethyltransferase RsmA [Pseudolysinimonas sp.]